MYNTVADWILYAMTSHLSVKGSDKIKIIWRSIGEVIFNDTADNLLDWKDADMYYVIRWEHDRETDTYIVKTI